MASSSYNVYIPIWLDLLYKSHSILQRVLQSLHSNMVRFIIYKMFD